MKRFAMMGALLGALVLGAASTSQAYYYPRPVARATARVVLPPYGPRVAVAPRLYGPRVYYGPRYYGPRFYGAPYRAWGPGIGVGLGVY